MSQQFLPLLKPQNIDELKSLILEIMEDNNIKLQKIIQSRQNQALEKQIQFTLDDLNQILTQEYFQKQKIVTNLSHFALSLMNTIQILWQDNQDFQYRIKDQRQIIQQLDQNLLQYGKQTDFLKNRLQIALNDINKIEEEKRCVQMHFQQVLNKYSIPLRKISQEFQKDENFEHQYNNAFLSAQELLNQQIEEKIQTTQRQMQEFIVRTKQLDTSISMIQKQQKKSFQKNEAQLLEESIIKDSISVIRQFTLADQQNQYVAQKDVPRLQPFNFYSINQKKGQLNRKQRQRKYNLSLINQISVKIFQNPKIQLQQNFFLNKTMIKDLAISTQKVNITIATGTQFTKTKDQQQKHQRSQLSLIQPSPSCTSFVLNRQTSAIMYPILQKSNSTIGLTYKTTKSIQTDYQQIKKQIRKDFKKGQKRIENEFSKQKSLINQKTYYQAKSQKKQCEKSEKNDEYQKKMKGKQQQGKKSFSQILDYFTKKIVSDRIKGGNKKNDVIGFKKSKSNIQKVF